MSEYWKSTPKYWCKHCKTFVKDTKLEKTNHDASPKHQGNIKRFLRDLHRGHEREERDKQRAKDEVQRLNMVVSGGSSSFDGAGAAAAVEDPGGVPWPRLSAIPPPSTNPLRQATLADRKQQLAQLAEMGVSIPEDFRKEMAMLGDWQTLSETPIDGTTGKRKEEENGDHKSDVVVSVGVRKRKYGEEEGEEDVFVRKLWGSATRSYPGQDDLDSLLGKTKMSMGSRRVSVAQSEKDQKITTEEHGSSKNCTPSVPEENTLIKKEDSADEKPTAPLPMDPDVKIKPEGGPPEAEVMFKKRKSKQIRQK